MPARTGPLRANLAAPCSKPKPVRRADRIECRIFCSTALSTATSMTEVRYGEPSTIWLIRACCCGPPRDPERPLPGDRRRVGLPCRPRPRTLTLRSLLAGLRLRNALPSRRRSTRRRCCLRRCRCRYIVSCALCCEWYDDSVDSFHVGLVPRRRPGDIACPTRTTRLRLVLAPPPPGEALEWCLGGDCPAPAPPSNDEYAAASVALQWTSSAEAPPAPTSTPPPSLTTSPVCPSHPPRASCTSSQLARLSSIAGS